MIHQEALKPQSSAILKLRVRSLVKQFNNKQNLQIVSFVETCIFPRYHHYSNSNGLRPKLTLLDIELLFD